MINPHDIDVTATPQVTEVQRRHEAEIEEYFDGELTASKRLGRWPCSPRIMRAAWSVQAITAVIARYTAAGWVYGPDLTGRTYGSFSPPAR